MTPHSPSDPSSLVSEERTLSFRAVNLLAIPVSVLLLGAALPFVAVWGWDTLAAGASSFIKPESLIPSLLLGLLAHEGLHALGWMVTGGVPRSTIRFGFKMSTLTPYAHCTAPMPADKYRIGVVTPAVALGALPLAVSLLTGSGWLAMFSLLFLIAASGDLILLWMLRDVSPGSLVQDHPSKPGCVVYRTP